MKVWNLKLWLLKQRMTLSRGRSAQKSCDCEKGCDGGQDGVQTGSPASWQTVFPVLADTACICHYMGYVVLLMDPM